VTLWDWIAVAVTAALVLEGVLKGAIRLAFGLAGLLAGFLYAGRVVPALLPYMESVPRNVRGPLAGFAGFLLILALFVAGGILLHKLAHAAGLGILNRLLGAVLGLAVAAYLAGGAAGLARIYAPSIHGSLEKSPVFSILGRGALFLGMLVPDPALPDPPEAGPPIFSAPEKA